MHITSIVFWSFFCSHMNLAEDRKQKITVQILMSCNHLPHIQMTCIENETKVSGKQYSHNIVLSVRIETPDGRVPTTRITEELTQIYINQNWHLQNKAFPLKLLKHSGFSNLFTNYFQTFTRIRSHCFILFISRITCNSLSKYNHNDLTRSENRY